jgi:hypothetical protein
MDTKYISRIAARVSSPSQDELDEAEYGEESDEEYDGGTPAASEPSDMSPAVESPASEMDQGGGALDDILEGLSDGLDGGTEYSSRIFFDMTVDFEGNVPQSELVATIKKNIRESLQKGMQEAANQLQLSAVSVKVMPIKMELSVIDESEYEPLRDETGGGDGHSDESYGDGEDDELGEDQDR